MESWENASDGTDGSEVDLQYICDEDHSYASQDIPQLQKRYVKSKARWDAEMGMAEIIENRGQMWTNTGIIRRSKLYCTIEETMFLVRLGALHLLDVDDATISLFDLIKMASDAKKGCSWELCEVYRCLKSLGYVIGRHGIPWSTKNDKSYSDSTCLEGIRESNGVSDKEVEENTSISKLFSDMNINEVKPIFDVYKPDKSFKKTSPGNPSFILCLTSGNPPSELEIKDLERRFKGVPLRFCYVEHEHVSFFSFDRIDLPVLP